MIKKVKPIKHKLWGRLKREAYYAYRIEPAHTFEEYIIIKRGDGLNSTDFPLNSTYGTLPEVQAKINRFRDMEFEMLCYRALFKRRLKKVRNL